MLKLWSKKPSTLLKTLGSPCCSLTSEQFTILKMLHATSVESKIYGFNYFYYSVMGLYIFLFFFLRNFPVIAYHWKGEYWYRLFKSTNDPFLGNTIGWTDRIQYVFAEWDGDFFSTSKGVFWKTGLLYFFLDQLHNIFSLASSSLSTF